MSSTSIVCQVDSFNVPNKANRIIDFMASALQEEFEVRYGQVTVVLMCEKTHTELNIKYLGHDYPTDILTFDLSDEEDTVSGDICINVQECGLNADEFGVPTEHELFRLFAHGLLHLVGLNDHSDEERANMRAWENRLLELIQEEGFM
jgi:probable rRNA maturation factor